MSEKKDKAPESKPDPTPDPTPETPEPEDKSVTFKTTRYPQVQVQVPGRTLRESIRFVAGEYTTADPEEIEVLESLEYAEQV